MAQLAAKNLPELRAVLLGSNLCGKRSVGNSILGTLAFDPDRSSAQCESYQGEVSGRRVTLVDTPGWWRELHFCDTAELVKAELLHSLSLCDPGPHAFIMVVDMCLPFTKAQRRAVKEHIQVFGEQVWSNTILLFTWAECRGSQTIEQYIKREEEVLQWLVVKCGNRCHVFNNDDSSDDSQVTELLEKIEDMVAANSGSHFESATLLSEEVKEMRRDVEERTQMRLSKVKEKREMLRALLTGGAPTLKAIQILLLGWVFSGKSSTATTILGCSKLANEDPTRACFKHQGEVAGRQLTVVDTPGWWKFLPAKLNREEVRDQILGAVSLCSPGPQAVLLVVPTDTSFREEQKRIIMENMEPFGENVWRHTMVLFTWGEWLGDVPIEKHIESEGEALQWLVEKCDNRYHVFNNKDRGDGTQVTTLLEKMEEMVAANNYFLYSTDAQSQVKTACYAEPQTLTNLDLLSTELQSDVLEKVLNQFSQKWDSKVKEIEEKFEKVLQEIRSAEARGDHSIGLPCDFAEEEKKTDVGIKMQDAKPPLTDMGETEPERRGRSSLREMKEREQVRMQVNLEREFARREAELMATVQATLQCLRDRDGVLSEPGDVEKELARLKVITWQTCSRSSGVYSGGLSDGEED